MTIRNAELADRAGGLMTAEDVGRLCDHFGEWLQAQRGRDSIVGELADRAGLDDGFPWYATPEAVRGHLLASGSDEAWLDALDAAARDWRGE